VSKPLAIEPATAAWQGPADPDSQTGRRRRAGNTAVSHRGARPRIIDALDVDLDLDPTLDVDGNVVV
jgi:hypothetical protein